MGPFKLICGLAMLLREMWFKYIPTSPIGGKWQTTLKWNTLTASWSSHMITMVLALIRYLDLTQGRNFTATELRTFHSPSWWWVQEVWYLSPLIIGHGRERRMCLDTGGSQWKPTQQMEWSSGCRITMPQCSIHARHCMCLYRLLSVELIPEPILKCRKHWNQNGNHCNILRQGICQKEIALSLPPPFILGSSSHQCRTTPSLFICTPTQVHSIDPQSVHWTWQSTVLLYEQWMPTLCLLLQDTVRMPSTY